MIRDRASATRTGAGYAGRPLPLTLTEGSGRTIAAPRRALLGRTPRRRHAASEADLPPFPERPAARALRAVAAKRVALVRERRGAVDRTLVVRALAEAAGAHLHWSDVPAGPGALEAALADNDAAVAESLPRSAVESRAFALRFHTAVVIAIAFGSSSPLRSGRCWDRVLVGATHSGARAWERSARVAARIAREEGRRRIDFAVREAGWPILPGERLAGFRRVAREHPDVWACRGNFHDVRRLLLFEPGALELIVADAGDLETLARAACVGVGWSHPVPRLHVGEARVVADLAVPGLDRRRTESGETALSAASLTLRLLRQLGEDAAAVRLTEAMRAELAERSQLARDLWLDHASDTVDGLTATLCERLAARVARAL